MDQGAWDAITALKNEAHHHEQRSSLDGQNLLARVERVERRMEDLERRFTEFKKAVWRS